MSLTLSLNNALAGLRTNQNSLGVLSQNIANVNTPGYSRQIVEQSALYIEGIGSGVRVTDVVRKVDNYLVRSLQSQASSLQQGNIINDYYQRIQVLMGEPGTQNSLDEYLSGFMNSLQQLAGSPEQTSLRGNAVAAAQHLAQETSGLAYELENLRFEADQEIRQAVSEVNSILVKLETLNTAIARGAGAGQSTAGLLDERDTTLRKLAGFLDISVSYATNGTVNVTAGNGVGLIDGTSHQLSYVAQNSVDSFIGGASNSPILVLTLDGSGNPVGNPLSLVTGGVSSNVQTTLTSGKLEGLRLLRDDVIPGILDQLDVLASNLRDAMNAIHNNGSGFPPASQLTGEREIVASDQFDWSGAVRIAVLRADGSPVSAGFANESYTGLRPLLLDLNSLNDGTGGDGHVTVQTLINEINYHFAAPTVKTSLGTMNNIQLVSDTNQLLVGGAPLFNFDFELDNISDGNASFFISGMTVRDSGGVDITNVTQNVPRITLDPAQAYYTSAGLDDVTITLQANPGLRVGDVIYLGPPAGADVGGIPAADITGYFTVEGVGGNSITISANNVALTTGTVPDASGAYMQTAYDTAGAGSKSRTRDKGELQVDFSMNNNSAYYDITVDVATVDADGNVTTSQITYRVNNNERDIRNKRYSSTAATGIAVRSTPTTTIDSLRAIMVDADGNEIGKVNGQYIEKKGYLKIIGGAAEYTIAFDELDSRQEGNLEKVPAEIGTNWGFSHFFGLNNFFTTNLQSTTGDTIKNSAINLEVSKRLVDNPNLVSTGNLVRANQTPGAGALPQYTYVRYAGDNSVAQKLAAISSNQESFEAAGGLPNISTTFQGYTSQILGYLASNTVAAEENYETANILYTGFEARAQAISGVNLDEELANTVIFQNAYSATARVVTVVNQMFEDILNMV